MRASGYRRRDFLQFVLAGGASAGLANLKAAFAQSGDTGASSASPMASGRPSATARGAALHRAAHQVLEQPRVLEDPFALRILGAQTEAALRADPGRFDRGRLMRAFIVLRSRFAEDQLARAVQRGVRQYVVLGAGLDTYALRNPHPASRLRVFEVDHPATQAWKRRQLLQAGIEIPDSMTFSPVDFERQTLSDGLAGAGFDAAQPAFFSLLGVVMYLTKPAAMGTLEFVAAGPASSEIVFDYSVPPEALDERWRAAIEAGAARVAAIGEPWITHFDPSALASELRRLGFSHLENLDAEQANRRYFAGRADGFRVMGPGQVLDARV